MNLPIIGVGLTMILGGVVLAGIGHYDGVIGADDVNQVLLEGGPATFRVTVLGSREEAQATFHEYQRRLVVPEGMENRLQSASFVPVEIENDEEAVLAFLQVQGTAPPVGTTLVVFGHVETEWPLFDAGSRMLSSMPVLFVYPTDYHEPVLFKR